MGNWINNNPNSPSLGITTGNTTNLNVSNGYAYNTAGVSYVFDTVQYSYLDVNAVIDGVQSGNLGEMGTCDVYVNGKLVADDVNDYWVQWPVGTPYEIRDIRTKNGSRFDGADGAGMSGVIESSENTVVWLKFSSLSTLSVGGVMDGAEGGDTQGYGTFDVYIDGKLDAQGVTSYSKSWPNDTAYEIRNVQPAEGKTFDGALSGNLTGTLSSVLCHVELVFTTNGTATARWQTANALPGNLDPALLDVEYENLYISEAMASPGEGYVRREMISSEWVDDGITNSYRPLTTSDTFVEKGWYYFHYCTGSKLGYANYESNATYVHYDSLPDANAVTVYQSGPDEENPAITYYMLKWLDGSWAKCSSGVTCDGSNGTHGERSHVWYRYYTYQARHLEEVYRWTRSSGWVEARDPSADRVTVRWRLKGGVELTPENITQIVVQDAIVLTAGETMTLDVSVLPEGIDTAVLTYTIENPAAAQLDENMQLTALYSPGVRQTVLHIEAPNGVYKDVPIEVLSNFIRDEWTLGGFAEGAGAGLCDVFISGEPVAFSYRYDLTNDYDPGYPVLLRAEGVDVQMDLEQGKVFFTGSGMVDIFLETMSGTHAYGRALIVQRETLMDLPQQIRKIENEAFAGTQARTFLLPQSVSSIGDGAFPQGAWVFLHTASLTELKQNPGVCFVEAGSTYNRSFAQAHPESYVAQRGAIIPPEWSDWSAWSSEEIAESDTVQVETKQQYRIAPVSESVVLGEWGEWSGWSSSHQTIADAELMQERTRNVYPYYYFSCPACGAHEPYWGNRTCYACGQNVYIDQGSFGCVTTEIAVPKSQCVQYDSIKYYTTYNGQRYFYWDDGSSPLQVIIMQYSYRVRSRNTVTEVGQFSEWCDGEHADNAGYQVERRTLYRYRAKQ